MASDQVIMADVKTQPHHINNKIIINQQHYFTDSIKIYQNPNQQTQPNQVAQVPKLQNQPTSPNSNLDDMQYTQN